MYAEVMEDGGTELQNKPVHYPVNIIQWPLTSTTCVYACIHIVLAVVLFLAPKIIQPPADFHMVTFNELTSSVRLMCSLNVTIPSSVTVVWTHNGNAVMATRRKQAMQNGNTTTLQIRNPRLKDVGNYQCVGIEFAENYHLG